jgi:hypothetical protein
MFRPAALSKATRTALFIAAAAADAGFSLRIVGRGKLEVLGPPGLPDDLCQPILDAVREHGPEVLRLVRWFADEERQGRVWRPAPELKGAPQ